MKLSLLFFMICLKSVKLQADYNIYSNDYSIRNLKKQHTETNYRNVRNYKPYSSPSFAESESCKLNIECGNLQNIGQIKLPIYGPPGAQGPPGAPGHRGAKGESGVNGIPARELPPPNFSAFFTALTNNSGPYTVDMNLVFKHVITNYGDNYDATTGHYTVPFNGVYQFFVTISATGRQKAGVQVMKNSVSILTVWSESEPWSTTSQTVILKLQRDDIVFLRLQARASHLHGYYYSSFGGSLMFESIN